MKAIWVLPLSPKTKKNHKQKPKPKKKTNKRLKNTIWHANHNPLFLVECSCFLQLTPYSLQKLCFPVNTIQKVFSTEHSFCGSQIEKNTFRDPFQKHPNKLIDFLLCSWNPHFCSVLRLYTRTKEARFAKTDSVDEMPFSTFRTHIASAIFQRKARFDKIHFCPPTPENTIFLGIAFLQLSFLSVFSVCLSKP